MNLNNKGITGSSFHRDKDIQRDAKLLKEISSILTSDSSLWKIKCEIPAASVPVLKTIYIPRNLECKQRLF